MYKRLRKEYNAFSLIYTCTPHLLGNLLGMAALFHSIHTLYGKHRICVVLHLSVTSQSGYGTTISKYQTAILY